MITKFKKFEGNEWDDPWGEENCEDDVDILQFRTIINKLGYNPTDIEHCGKDPHPNGWKDYDTDMFYFNIDDKKFSIQLRYYRRGPQAFMIYYKNRNGKTYLMRKASIKEITNAFEYLTSSEEDIDYSRQGYY